MEKIIKLHNPIKITGEEVSEIKINTEEITAALYAEADARKRLAAGSKNITIAPSVEFDFGLHAYLGYAAAIAANPGITFSDMERIHGRDVIYFSEVGRNFLLKSEGATSKPSGEQSETTPEPSTQA